MPFPGRISFLFQSFIRAGYCAIISLGCDQNELGQSEIGGSYPLRKPLPAGGAFPLILVTPILLVTQVTHFPERI